MLCATYNRPSHESHIKIEIPPNSTSMVKCDLFHSPDVAGVFLSTAVVFTHSLRAGGRAGGQGAGRRTLNTCDFNCSRLYD